MLRIESSVPSIIDLRDVGGGFGLLGLVFFSAGLFKLIFSLIPSLGAGGGAGFSVFAPFFVLLLGLAGLAARPRSLVFLCFLSLIILSSQVGQ